MSSFAASSVPLAADMKAIADERTDEMKRAVEPITEKIYIRTGKSIRAAAAQRRYRLRVTIWDWQKDADSATYDEATLSDRNNMQNIKDTQNLDEFSREEVSRQLRQRFTEYGYTCDECEYPEPDEQLAIYVSWASG